MADVDITVKTIDKTAEGMNEAEKRMEKSLAKLKGSFPGDELGASMRQYMNSFDGVIDKGQELAGFSEEWTTRAKSFAAIEKQRLAAQEKSLDGQKKSFVQGIRTLAGYGIAAMVAKRAIGAVTDAVKDYLRAAEETPELFSSEQLKRAQALSKSTSELSDSFERAKISAIDSLAPALTSITNELTEGFTRASIYKKRLAELTEGMGLFSNQIDEMREAGDFADSIIEGLDGISDATMEAMKSSDKAMLVYAENAGKRIKLIGAEAESIEKLSGILSITQSMQSGADSFNDKQEATKERIEENLEAIHEATREYGAYSDEVAELSRKHIELTASMSDNTKQFEKDTQRRVLARAKELLSAGGLSVEEEKYLIEQGLNLGVYTDNVATAALMVIDDAQSMADGFEESTDMVTSSITTASDMLSSVDGQTATMSLVLETLAEFEGIPRGPYDDPRNPAIPIVPLEPLIPVPLEPLRPIPLEPLPPEFGSGGGTFSGDQGSGDVAVYVSIGTVNSQQDVNYLIQQIGRGLQK